MSDATDDRIRSIFDQAADLSPSDRAALLDRICPRTDDLRRRVDALLAAHDAADQLIDAPVAATELRSIAGTTPPMEGESIGDFRIGALIGSGGMGVVYRAHQQSLHREVALKLIRPGAPGSSLLRRFEREAFALARLRHPGIAMIHEYGTIDLGAGAQPYLAMELIDGPDLITYTEHLSIPERLDLLARICDAVHYAHTRGIIHRDLKPDNILVGSDGQPKILDFGIARMTDAPGGLTLTRTGERGVIGTVAYMSPEQLSGTGEEPDLRSDVYALGVIGYRMLGGRMPHDLTGCTLLEAARRICSESPVPLRRINTALGGDIEAIVDTAMAVDLQRRYQSAAAVADDIRRHLRGEPIAARSLSTLEHLRAAVHRNRLAFRSAVVVSIALIAGLALAGAGLQRAIVAESVALARGDEAERQRAIAQSITEFLIDDLLLAVNPNRSLEADVTVVEILQNASERIHLRDFPEPIVMAEIDATIGNAYRMLGRFHDALPHLVRAQKTLTEALGRDDPRTIRNDVIVALMLYESGSLAEAEAAIPEMLSRLEGAPDLLDREVYDMKGAWCSLLIDRSRYDEAEVVCYELLDHHLRTSGSDHQNTLIVRSHIARLHLDTEHLEPAREMFAEILAARRRIAGDDDTRTTSSMNNLAIVLIRMGRFAEAEPLLAEALHHRRRVLGDMHIRTLLTLGNLSVSILNQDRADEAIAMLEQTIDGLLLSLPPEHTHILAFRSALGQALSMTGQYESAESLLLQAWSDLDRTAGARHSLTISAHSRVSDFYDRWTVAEPQGEHLDRAAEWRARTRDAPAE